MRFVKISMAVLLLVSCKSRECGRYYDKMKVCDVPTFGMSRAEFIDRCKSVDGNDRYLECADKTACSDFISCVQNK